MRCELKSCRKWREISHLLRRRNRRTAAKKQQEQKNYNSKDDITVVFNGFRKKILSETDGTGQGPTEVYQQSLKYRGLVRGFSYQMKIMKYDHLKEFLSV